MFAGAFSAVVPGGVWKFVSSSRRDELAVPCPSSVRTLSPAWAKYKDQHVP